MSLVIDSTVPKAKTITENQAGRRILGYRNPSVESTQPTIAAIFNYSLGVVEGGLHFPLDT